MGNCTTKKQVDEPKGKNAPFAFEPKNEVKQNEVEEVG